MEFEHETPESVDDAPERAIRCFSPALAEALAKVQDCL